MRAGDIEDLLSLMKGGTKTNTLTPEREAFWKERMNGLDVELATETVLRGVENWEFFPAWSEFHGAYQTVARRRQQEAEGIERRRVEADYDRENAGRRIMLPLWIKRWYVARFVVSPADMRRFPEQDGEFVTPGEHMPDGEHVELAERMTDAESLLALRKAFAAGAIVEEP